MINKLNSVACDQESLGHIMGTLSRQVKEDFLEVMPELGFKVS